MPSSLKEVSNAAEETRAYLEYHIYSGGLDYGFFGERQRPEWLPSQDEVGLDNEVELKRGEFAIELARFLRHGRRITWIGCFTHTVDQVHGDRGNYCGAGVWLNGMWPALPTFILLGLRDLCRTLSDPQATENRDSQFKSFLKDYLLGYVQSLNTLPMTLPSLPFFEERVPETKYFHVPLRGSCDEEFSAIGWSILGLCISAPSEMTESRVLYLLTRDSVLKVASGKVLQLANQSDVGPSVISALLKTYSQHTEKLNVISKEREQYRRQAEDVIRQLTSLSSEKKRLQEENDRLRSPSRDSLIGGAPPLEYQRALLERLSGITGEIEKIQRHLRDVLPTPQAEAEAAANQAAAQKNPLTKNKKPRLVQKVLLTEQQVYIGMFSLVIAVLALLLISAYMKVSSIEKTLQVISRNVVSERYH